jgi:Lon protease-like protein
MFNPADLPENIPLFPLPRALLLPRTRLPLNIFEPRYLAMLEDVLKTSQRLIGMVQPMETAPDSDDPRLHLIGCAGRVVAFTETGDGRYMISLGGISRFRIRDIKTGFSPYARAEIDWSSFNRDLGKTEKDPTFKRGFFLERLERFFSAVDLNSDWQSLKEANDEMLINSLSMLCPFDVEDKQALLEAPTLTDRRETLLTLIEYAIASGGDEGALQ